MIILLLWLFFGIALGCEDGFYDSGGICLPCESSCKTCSQDGECTECDDYMFMDDMTGMCDHCPDGEFYDFSLMQCNSCADSCNGYCGYQERCYVCDSTEVLNIETMTCVPSCPVGTIQFSDPIQYKLSSFCRSMDYYVDPSSEEIMELGTKAYPYRTISPVFAEILKQHSHKDRKVSIFIKEGTNVFIQDSTAFFINVTQVSVSTYNQNSISQGMATITTTDTIVEGLSKKAVFHLMKDLTLDIGSVVSYGNFSDAEMGSIGRGGDTFQCVRTSLGISKIVARIIAKTTTSGVFIYLLYLQQKEIKLTDVEFHVTGTVLYTKDPCNMHLENLFMNTYQVIAGIMFWPDCNYPEAFWTPTFYVKNFTAAVLSNEAEAYRPNVLYYSGPGNVTAININISANYGLAQLGLSTFLISIEPPCIPSDGLTKLVEIDTVHTALPDNVFKAKINMFVITGGVSYSRPQIINVSNLNLEKAYGASLAYVIMFLASGDTVNLRNFHLKDYDSTSSSVWITGGMVEFKNMTFEDIPSHPNGHILLDYSDTINIEGITFRNFTGHSSPIGHLVSLTNNPTQNGTIRDFVIENSDLKNQKPMVLSATFPVQSLIFERIIFSNVRYSESHTLIQIASVKNLIINNLIFRNVSSSSSVDISSSSFLVSQVDLNSTENIEIGEIQYQNSSISLISMLTFVNTPPSTRLINLKNIEFTNSNLVSQISIIRTEGIQYDLDLVLNFDNLTFSDIEFKSKGYLLNLDQQLPSNLTISNSRFMNIKQGIINIASTKVENPDLLASVHLFNITAENIQENEASFVNVEQEGRLFVSDSSFKNMYIYQDGGVLSGGSSNTITVISNSTFENNSALNGGVFNVKEQSVIKIYSCNITSNFAITSGVINVVSNGQFEIYDSLIYNNHANKNPVSQLLDTAETSVISNSKIYLNHAFSKASIISEFSSCSQLCFVNQNFKDYSNANFLSEMSETHNEYQFSLIFASLSMISATEINQESLVVDSFVSTLEITDTVIRDFTMEAVAIRGVSSTISLTNLSFVNFTVTDQVDYILDTLDSTLSITNSTSIIFRARSSQVNIQGLTYELIANAIELGVISSCYDSTISGLTSTLSEVLGRSLLRFESSQNISLSNVVLKNTQKNGIRILSSSIKSIENITITKCEDGSYIESSSVELFRNSLFESNGNSSKINGGALHIINSDVTLSNNIFRQNTAHDGGAIAFTCTSTSLCSLAIPSSIFTLNNATERGGAVYYDYKRPTFGQDIEYSDNSAQYGKNIASYAVKIVFEGTSSDEMKLEDLAPGIAYDGTLKFAVKDYDDQIMVLDSHNQISLIAANSTAAEVKGFNIQPLVNGIASFDNFIVHTSPGNQDVIVTASSKAIDQAKISTVFGNPISNNTIEVDTRFCKPGERIVDNICNTCSAGTYSFAWNSTECSQCMDDAICSGGTEINVNPGYWRFSLNSTSVIECINKEACDGGYQNSEIQPTNCATGYQGNLCTKCSVTENDKYQAVGGLVCQKCPNPILNAIRVIFVGFVVFAYFMVLIIVNVRKTSESEISILLKILTNYVQIISLSLSFSTKYPSSLSDILVPAETLGSSSEAFLSFDCFVMDSEIKGPFPSSIFFKIFLMIWMPLIIFLLVTLIWVLIYYIKPKWVPNLTRNLVISFVSIVFLLHPKLAQESMNLFRCVNIDEGVMKTRIDTDIDCYSPEHGKWIAILGLPILIIWVIAMPLSALIFLYKKTRAGTESNMVTEYFLILYQGLKIKHFYWEFVNSLRKVCILISFALPTSGQIMFALLILLVTWRLQDFLKPYKRKQNNGIEIFGINISIITLCCGLIFNQDKTLKSLNNILLTIMVIFNILFILKWLHLLFLTLGAKHAFFKNVACVLRYLSLERSEDQFANLDFPKDSTVEPHKTLKKRKSKRRHTKTKEENKEESYRKRYKKKSSRGRRIRKKLLPRGGSKMMMKIREQQTDMRMLSSK